MSRKIGYHIMFTCLLSIPLIMPVTSFAVAYIPRSAALQTVFDQAEVTYLSHITLGLTTEVAINKKPTIFANSVGLAMQRQSEYMSDNGDYIFQLEALSDEAITFVEQLAKEHNYIDPVDGSDLPVERMGWEYLSGLAGLNNADWVERYGLDPATVDLPFILSEVSLPQDTGEGDIASLPRLHVKKGNEINLLEELAPPAESAQTFDDETPPPSQHQNSSAPAAAPTGCSGAKFTVKPDNLSPSPGYYNIVLRFSQTATIFTDITKVVVTYNNQLQMELARSGSWHQGVLEWYDHLKLSDYSLKQPYNLTFEAYDDQGKVICRGKTQYQYKSKK